MLNHLKRTSLVVNLPQTRTGAYFNAQSPQSSNNKIRNISLYKMNERKRHTMSICYFGCFPFGFEDRTVVLIDLVPGSCLPLTLSKI